jgi:hypothetical protein
MNIQKALHYFDEITAEITANEQLGNIILSSESEIKQKLVSASKN